MDDYRLVQFTAPQEIVQFLHDVFAIYEIRGRIGSEKGVNLLFIHSNRITLSRTSMQNMVNIRFLLPLKTRKFWQEICLQSSKKLPSNGLKSIEKLCFPSGTTLRFLQLLQ